MQIDQSLVYIVVLVFTVLTAFLVGIVFVYLRLVKRYTDAKEGRDKYPDPKALLLRAHAKSQKIIEDATDKARQIITSAEEQKKNDLDEVQKQIEKAQKENYKIYKDSVSKIQDESMKLLQNVPEYIKALLSKEIMQVQENLVSEIRVAHENAKDVITQAYKKADDEVEEYKKVRMDALDKTIISIVQQISRKVLNKEIEAVEHEKLVIKALEEAKRQNVFLEDGGSKSSGNEGESESPDEKDSN